VDTSSDPSNTVELRHRIETGDVLGPRIYTAGFGLYPPHGIINAFSQAPNNKYFTYRNS
jgi:hypothetical protein